MISSTQSRGTSVTALDRRARISASPQTAIAAANRTSDLVASSSTVMLASPPSLIVIVTPRSSSCDWMDLSHGFAARVTHRLPHVLGQPRRQRVLECADVLEQSQERWKLRARSAVLDLDGDADALGEVG